LLSFITDPPTHSVVEPVLFCRLLSVGVCNTPRRACRRLHVCRPGDDIMLLAV